MIDGKTILVTGGTGSFGKTFVKKLLVDFNPRKIIVFSRDEAKQHFMRVEYKNMVSPTEEIMYKNFEEKLEFRIGDIRDYDSVIAAIQGVDIVVNAAALKQVPSCEYFPLEAIKTNCLGVANLIKAINTTKNDVKVCIGISTDKATKPINVMGMTKALQEKLFIAANINSECRFTCVRYGNVLASRGSVIPFFHDQIKNGQDLTVTHVQMTRFLMSLNDSVSLVLDAINYGGKGQIFVPITPSAKMIDLANVLKDFNQHQGDIKIVGIRPGEKLHEELVSSEEGCRTYHAEDLDRYIIYPMLPEITNVTTHDLRTPYSSKQTSLTRQELKEFLDEHNLLYVDKAFNGELLC